MQDARRHGVKVLPADVRYSDWDCSLEAEALRLGLRMVKGMREDSARRLERARAERSFAAEPRASWGLDSRRPAPGSARGRDAGWGAPELVVEPERSAARRGLPHRRGQE